jgi:hypothetical protein
LLDFRMWDLQEMASLRTVFLQNQLVIFSPGEA